jgi:RNA recognition motif-containing protein
MHIYVGNLDPEVTDEELRGLFEKHGKVHAATVARDKATGKSQEYGFVEMSVKSEAREAVEALRGKDLKGKPLRVKILKPEDELHQHALNLHGGAVPGPRTANTVIKARSATPYRGSGAIRRGGRRGG